MLKSEGVYVPACAFQNVCATLLPTFCCRHGQENLTQRSKIDDCGAALSQI